jgi:hypothetical protein
LILKSLFLSKSLIQRNEVLGIVHRNKPLSLAIDLTQDVVIFFTLATELIHFKVPEAARFSILLTAIPPIEGATVTVFGSMLFVIPRAKSMRIVKGMLFANLGLKDRKVTQVDQLLQLEGIRVVVLEDATIAL